MKLFQHNQYSWEDEKDQHHYQFLIIKDKTLLHLMREVDNSYPYTGIHILTSLFAPDCLFSMELQVKGYSWSFWLFSNYWAD